MKKKLILFFLGFISNFGFVVAQDVDRIRLFTSGDYGILPIKISGTMDIGNGNEGVSNGHVYVSAPVYRHVDTTAIMMNTIGHFGINIPFYKTESWSIGAKFSAGVGYQFSFRAAEGLNSPFLLDFPQYCYYRNYKHNFDYSVLLGYKYNYSALPYHLFLVAFDFNVNNLFTFRIYGSPFSYKYYAQYTNGNLEPMVKIKEFGISFILHRKMKH